MGRSLLSIVLLVAFTQAQTRAVAASELEPTRMDPTTPVKEWMEAIPQYASLRQGSEEKIMLVVSLNPTSEITTYWGPPNPQKNSLIATELIIDPIDGFTVDGVEYPRLKRVTMTDGTVMRLLGPDSIDLHFKLRADSAANMGDRSLSGRLRFQRVGKVGVSAPQELKFTIPVRVVEHKAKVNKNPYYPWEITPLGWVGMVGLMPILLPIAFLTWDGC